MGNPEDGKHIVSHVDICIAVAGLISACIWFFRDPEPDSFAGSAAAAITLIEVLRVRNRPGSKGLEFNLLRTWHFLTPIVTLIMFWALIREILKVAPLSAFDQSQSALLLTLLILCFTMIALRILSPRLGRLAAHPPTTKPEMFVQIDEVNTTFETHHHAPPKEPGRLEIMSIRVTEGAYETRNFRRRFLQQIDDTDLEIAGFFPILELALENSGEQPSVVEQIEINVYDAYRRHDSGMPIHASWEFTELLDPRHLPGRYRIAARNLSISPNRTARIMFTVGHVLGHGHYDSVRYRASIKIYYDGDQATDPQDCTFTIYCPRDFSPEAPTPIRLLPTANR